MVESKGSIFKFLNWKRIPELKVFTHVIKMPSIYYEEYFTFPKVLLVNNKLPLRVTDK